MSGHRECVLDCYAPLFGFFQRQTGHSFLVYCRYAPLFDFFQCQTGHSFLFSCSYAPLFDFFQRLTGHRFLFFSRYAPLFDFFQRLMGHRFLFFSRYAPLDSPLISRGIGGRFSCLVSPGLRHLIIKHIQHAMVVFLPGLVLTAVVNNDAMLAYPVHINMGI